MLVCLNFLKNKRARESNSSSAAKVNILSTRGDLSPREYYFNWSWRTVAAIERPRLKWGPLRAVSSDCCWLIAPKRFHQMGKPWWCNSMYKSSDIKWENDRCLLVVKSSVRAFVVAMYYYVRTDLNFFVMPPSCVFITFHTLLFENEMQLAMVNAKKRISSSQKLLSTSFFVLPLYSVQHCLYSTLGELILIVALYMTISSWCMQ